MTLWFLPAAVALPAMLADLTAAAAGAVLLWSVVSHRRLWLVCLLACVAVAMKWGYLPFAVGVTLAMARWRDRLAVWAAAALTFAVLYAVQRPFVGARLPGDVLAVPALGFVFCGPLALAAWKAGQRWAVWTAGLCIGFLVISVLLKDAAAYDPRLYLPAVVALTPAACAWRNGAKWAIFVAGAVITAVSWRPPGGGFDASGWRNQPSLQVAWAAAVAGKRVATNCPAGVWWVTGKATLPLDKSTDSLYDNTVRIWFREYGANRYYTRPDAHAGRGAWRTTRDGDLIQEIGGRHNEVLRFQQARLRSLR